MSDRSILGAAVWNADERRPRTLVRLLGHAGLLLVLVVALALSVGIALGRNPFGGLAPLETLAVNVAMTGTLVVLATLVAARYLDRREWHDVGLSLDRRWWRDLAAGLALGSALQTGIFLTSLAAGWTRIDAVAGAGALPWLLAGGVLMAAVGFYEELWFRGYYLVNLAEGLRAVPHVTPGRAVVAAAALTSLAFGGLHGANPNATAISTGLVAGYGAYLALGYLLTGDLALPVGFHAAWNYVQGFVYGFPVSGIDLRTSVLATETAGPKVLTGGQFGPEAGVVGIAWVTLSLPFVWLWVRRTRGRVAVREDIAMPDLRVDAVDSENRLHPDEVGGGAEREVVE